MVDAPERCLGISSDIKDSSNNSAIPEGDNSGDVIDISNDPPSPQINSGEAVIDISNDPPSPRMASDEAVIDISDDPPTPRVDHREVTPIISTSISNGDADVEMIDVTAEGSNVPPKRKGPPKPRPKFPGRYTSK